MKRLILLFSIFALTACSSVSPEEQEAAWEEWNGLPVSSLEDHSYFRHLPVTKIKHEEGLETWIYNDQSRFQTDAYCESLGGCIGMPTYNCNNAFSVQDGIILGLEQSGSCPGIKTIEAPNK